MNVRSTHRHTNRHLQIPTIKTKNHVFQIHDIALYVNVAMPLYVNIATNRHLQIPTIKTKIMYFSFQRRDECTL